ncbi:DUF983 domain-containing protein [Adhaeribacter soli]|nr:DUF983 domain-containing protein [Adhaeribacter soli]
MKCPRCNEGDLFPPGTFYSPSRFSEMYSACPCCGQTYEPEPGFYYGAMYVSFAISTAIFLGVLFVLYFLVDEITFTMVLTSILVIVIGLLPVTFRLSRSMWLNIFVHYEGPCNQIRKK